MDNTITKKDFDGLVELVKKIAKKPTIVQQYYRLGEAPRYLGISPRTFTNWRKRGIVPVSVIGGITLVNRDDLDALLDKYRIGEIKED